MENISAELFIGIRSAFRESFIQVQREKLKHCSKYKHIGVSLKEHKEMIRCAKKDKFFCFKIKSSINKRGLK